MNYEIFFTRDEDRRRVQSRGRLPDPIKQSIIGALEEIAKSPYDAGVLPPMPYNGVGLLHTCKCMYEKRLYITQFFYHADDETKKVVVRRVIMEPQYNPPSA